MYFALSIWNDALGVAGDLLYDLAGLLLGWGIVLGLLAVLFLAVYFVLRKMGWVSRSGPTFRFRFGAEPPDLESLRRTAVDPEGGVQVVTRTATIRWEDPQAKEKLEQVLEGIGTADPAVPGCTPPSASIAGPEAVPEWQQELMKQWELERRQK